MITIENHSFYEAGKLAIQLENLEKTLIKYIKSNDLFGFYTFYKAGMEMAEEHDKFVGDKFVQKRSNWKRDFFENELVPLYNKIYKRELMINHSLDETEIYKVEKELNIEIKNFFWKHYQQYMDY